MESLLNIITHYVAYPRTIITERDKKTAILIMNAVGNYLLDAENPDFVAFASEQLDLLEEVK